MLKMYTVLSTFAEVMSRFGNVYDTIMIAKVRVGVYRKTLAKVCDNLQKMHDNYFKPLRFCSNF